MRTRGRERKDEEAAGEEKKREKNDEEDETKKQVTMTSCKRVDNKKSSGDAKRDGSSAQRKTASMARNVETKKAASQKDEGKGEKAKGKEQEVHCKEMSAMKGDGAFTTAEDWTKVRMTALLDAVRAESFGAALLGSAPAGQDSSYVSLLCDRLSNKFYTCKRVSR